MAIKKKNIIKKLKNKKGNRQKKKELEKELKEELEKQIEKIDFQQIKKINEQEIDEQEIDEQEIDEQEIEENETDEKDSLLDLTKTELLTISRELGLGLTFMNNKDDIVNKIVDNVNKNIYLPEAVYMPMTTISQDKCSEKFIEWNISGKLSQGGFGSVSEVCRIEGSIKNCNYILKAQNISEYVIETAYLTELDVYNDIKNNGLDIGPKLISDWFCLYRINLPGLELDIRRSKTQRTRNIKIGYMILDKWDGDIYTLAKKQQGLTDKQLGQIEIILNKLHKLGWVHRDPKLNNFLYKIVNINNEIKIKIGIIDFGLTEKIYSLNNSTFSLDSDFKIEETYNVIPGYRTHPGIDFLLLKLWTEKRFNKKITRFDKYIKEIFINKEITIKK